MTPRFFLALLFLLSARIHVLAQNRLQNHIPLDNSSKSLSITYAYDGASPFFTAAANTHSDAVNGSSFNGGRAIVYKVNSDRPYSVGVFAENSSGPSVDPASRPVDIRQFIYYRLVENHTNGYATGNVVTPNGERLGTEERTIITNCPPTKIESRSGPGGDETSKTFSLQFSLKAGYSLPPGNYSTNLLVTATYE